MGPPSNGKGKGRRDEGEAERPGHVEDGRPRGRADLQVGGGRGLAEDVAGDAGVEAAVGVLHLLDHVDVGVARGGGSLKGRTQSVSYFVNSENKLTCFRP